MSGRRKHPVASPAGSLTALAGRLTDGDWQVCRLLADHQVLTTGLFAQLLGVAPRTLQQRLTILTTLKVVDRFRPHQPVGGGSAPYHYLLGEAGTAILAADDDSHVQGLGSDRTRLLGVAHANGRLHHLLGVNTLLAQLTHTARQQPGTRLVCWWPARRCQAQWGRLIRPDAYARWCDPHGEVDFFLHHIPAADLTAGRLAGYNELAAATGITTPVLLHAGDPDQEAQLRDRLGGLRLLVPVAISNPTLGPPTEAVWLPSSRPAGGPRYRLGALGRPDPWHSTPAAGSAAPAPDTAAADRRRPVEDLAGWR